MATTTASTFPAAASAQSLNTRRIYGQDFDVYRRWCQSQGMMDCFCVSVSQIFRWYESMTLNRRPLVASTILRRLYAVAWHLRAAGHGQVFEDQSLRDLMRRLGHEGSKRRDWQAIRAADLRKMFRQPPKRVTEFRNRALVLLMFVLRLTPRVVRNIHIGDVRFVSEGLVVTIGGKAHRVDRGTTALCPVAAIEKWIEKGSLRSGLLFPISHRHASQRRAKSGMRLADTAIREILRGYAEAIGMNPAGISCRSLLAGAELDYNATRALGL